MATRVAWSITNEDAGEVAATAYIGESGYTLAETWALGSGATQTWQSEALGTVLFAGRYFVEIGGGNRMWVHTGIGDTVLGDGPGYVGGFPPDLAEVAELSVGARVERVLEGRVLTVERSADGVAVGFGG